MDPTEIPEAQGSDAHKVKNTKKSSDVRKIKHAKKSSDACKVKPANNSSDIHKAKNTKKGSDAYHVIFNRKHISNTIRALGGIYCRVCKETYPDRFEYNEHYKEHSPSAKTIIYTCVVCNKDVPGYSKFWNHCYNIHISQNKYKCDECPKQFAKITNLRLHIDSMHPNFRCTYPGPPACPKKFTSHNELRKHLRTHKSEAKKSSPPYPCAFCQGEIISVSDSLLHADKHVVESYNCPICDEYTVDKASATYHLHIHFSEKPAVDAEQTNSVCPQSPLHLTGGIRCPICEHNYRIKAKFDKHFKNEHPNKTVVYECNICYKKYEKYRQFSTHCYDHHVAQKFVCEHCYKSFNRLPLLMAHSMACASGRLRRKPANPLTLYKCKHCTITFTEPKDLANHEEIHKNINNWCKKCGIQFLNLTACEKHLEIHKINFFSCPICAKEYNKKQMLINHINAHFDKTHFCDVCGRTYNAKNRLMEHMKTHLDAKFACNFCGKTFAKRDNYRQHVNIHTGQKPYACVVCDKSFTNYSNWSKHLRKMHNLEPKDVKTDAKIKANNNNNVENTVPRNGQIVDIQVTDIDDDILLPDALDSSDSVELDSITPSVLEDIGLTNDVAGVDASINNYADYVSDTSLTSLETEPPLPQAPLKIPCEYGPEFNTEIDPIQGTLLIDVDEQIMPHIDPRLTLNTQPIENDILSESSWEPPIISKTCDKYLSDTIESFYIGIEI